MISISDIDKRILEELQNDLPLISQPFTVIADKIGIPEKVLLEKIKYLLSEKIIRNFSAIINTSKIGFQSALIALSVKENNINNIVRKINEHNGVSHNYLRNHTFNIWFTLTISKDINLSKEVNNILAFEKESVVDYIILPSVRTFKIGVNFRFSQKKYDIDKNTFIENNKEIEISNNDKAILNKLQENILIAEHPWGKIASSVNISESQLFERIHYLKDSGIIRRISAVINHHNAGILFNVMCCLKIPDEQVISAGIKISEHPQITHCYQRKTYTGKWEYPLFAMIHAETQYECDTIIKSLAKEINCNDYITLHSLKELKKERIRFEIR